MVVVDSVELTGSNKSPTVNNRDNERCNCCYKNDVRWL